MLLYLVTCDTAGAHESDDVMSIWTSEEKALAEINRLQEAKDDVSTTYGGEFYVAVVLADSESNVPLNW